MTTDTTRLKRHAALVDRMATARGLDLEESILRGRFTISDLEDAVLACTGCAQACLCHAWLGALDPAGGPVEAGPDYCRNGAVFDGLIARESR